MIRKRINSVVKVGVVGIGGMGKKRVKFLRMNKNVEIVAICDITEEATKLADLYDTSFLVKNYPEFLAIEEMDAVILCVPNNLHFPYSVQALKAGKHVLVEYPMALSVEEAEEMTLLTKEKGLVLHPGHTMRFEPEHIAIKNNLDRIGKMIFVSGYLWYGRNMLKWYGNHKLRGDTFTFLN